MHVLSFSCSVMWLDHVERACQRISYHQICIKSAFCPRLSGDVPISTPYLNLFYPFSDAGVDDLTSLLTSTVNQTRGGDRALGAF